MKALNNLDFAFGSSRYSKLSGVGIATLDGYTDDGPLAIFSNSDTMTRIQNIYKIRCIP